LNTLNNENNKAFLDDIISQQQKKQMSTTFQSALKKSDSALNSPTKSKAKMVRFNVDNNELIDGSCFINEEDDEQDNNKEDEDKK